jgi:hypothetical protein
MKYAFHPALADRHSDPDHPAAGALHASFLIRTASPAELRAKPCTGIAGSGRKLVIETASMAMLQP